MSLKLCCMPLMCALIICCDDEGQIAQLTSVLSEGRDASEIGTDVKLAGNLRFNGSGMKDVRVVVVPEFGDRFASYETQTRDNGRFEISLDRPGAHSLMAYMPLGGSVMSAVMYNMSVDGDIDLGELNLSVYNTTGLTDQNDPRQNVLDRVQEGAYRCDPSGCVGGIACYTDLVCVCCGVNACDRDVHICLPYGRKLPL